MSVVRCNNVSLKASVKKTKKHHMVGWLMLFSHVQLMSVTHADITVANFNMAKLATPQ